MKRIAFCFDGTWNKIDGDYPTNVARVAQSISRFDKNGVPQIIYYDEGVGTTATERLSGGIFGHGLIEKIIEAYHFLVLNYEPGDELHVFGFSRGAFTARSFVGMIRNCGIMSRRSLNHIREAVKLYCSRSADAHPDSETMRQFRYKHCPKLALAGDVEWRRTAYPDASTDLTELRIAFLGVWDTVGALGVPGHLKLLSSVFNRKFAFHDTDLSRVVRRARHAVSVDEKRRSFAPSMWTNLGDLNAPEPEKNLYQQVYFPGTHGGVGGGGPVRGLSDAALEWVFRGASDEGLAFDRDDQSPIFLLRPDPRCQLFNETGKKRWSIKDRLMGVGLADRKFPAMDRQAIHDSLLHRFRMPAEQLAEGVKYRPTALKEMWTTIADMGALYADRLQAELIEVKSLGDDRALRAPDSVRKYRIKAGDTLKGIARTEMGNEADATLLSLHNRNVGLLFEDGLLYAGSEIEIPVYKAPLPKPEPSPGPTPVEPPAAGG